MNANYLTGVGRHSSSFKGIEILSAGADSWYAGNYGIVTSASFESTKNEIVSLTNKATRANTKAGDWHWHHVVETNHLEKILVSGNITAEKFVEMPTVMIHSKEHVLFNGNFRRREFLELTNTTRAELLTPPVQMLLTPEGRAALRRRLSNLRDMYEQVYLNYPLFHQIASNVFNMQQQIIG